MRLTVSKMALAELCGWPFRPEVDVPRSGGSPFADRGNAFHALAEGDEEGAADFLAKLDDRMQREVWEGLAAYKASPWSKPAWRHESAYCYRPSDDTARVLLKGAHRDYSAVDRATEIPGTADLVLVEGDCVTVGDFKTGWRADRDPADHHAQLRALALFAARAHGCTRARIVVLGIGTDGVTATDAHLDELDLAGIAAEVRATWQSIPTATPRPGLHCTQLYCPALAVCPAVAAAETGLAAVEPAALTITAENAGALLVRLKVVRAKCDAIEAGLRQFADFAGGVKIDGGKVWCKREVRVEPINLEGENQAAALAVLKTAGAANAVDHTPRVTKADVRRELAKRGLAGKALDDAEETLMDGLRALRATRPHTQPRYDTRKA